MNVLAIAASALTFTVASAFISTMASSATLWSGSLVEASSDQATQKISVNYPGRGVGRICGVELKTKTMILNHRVWTGLLAGLSVSAEYDDQPMAITPTVTQEEGGRLYFLFDDNGAFFSSLVVTVKSGVPVARYFAEVLENPDERTVFVAKECIPGLHRD